MTYNIRTHTRLEVGYNEVRLIKECHGGGSTACRAIPIVSVCGRSSSCLVRPRPLHHPLSRIRR